jgi:protein TonB
MLCAPNAGRFPCTMAMHVHSRHRSGRAGGIRAAGVRFAFILAIHVAIVTVLLQLSPELRRQVAPVLVSIISSPPPAPPEAPAPKPVVPMNKVRPAEVVRPSPAPRTDVETTTAPTAIAAESSTPVDSAAPSPSQAVGERASAAVQGTPAPPAAVPTPSPPPVVPPRFDAAYLKNPRPDYPRAAKRMGEQGKVMLRVYVSTTGAPEKIEIGTSSGSRRLDEAARAAVEQWKFLPARQGDVPVAAWVTVPITFALEG